MKNILVAVFAFFTFTTFAQAQKADDAQRHDKLPEKFIKPDKWIYADTVPMVWEDFYCNDVLIKNLTFATAMNLIDKNRNFCSLYSALIWCRKNYREAFPELIKRLTDSTNVGLEHYTDLNVVGRDEFNKGNPISTGQKPGIVINEDIFTIAGRASWILNSITGETFSSVRKGYNQQKLKNIEESWMIWIKELKRN